MYLFPSNRLKTIYQGTLTGLRISSVDGTAFVDNGAALTAYADGNHQLSIYDASGRILQGVLKAAGDGEDVGSTLVSNGDMETGDPPTGWLGNATSVLDSAAEERTGGAGSKCLSVVRGTDDLAAYVVLPASSGVLYKFTGWTRRVTAGYSGFTLFDAASGFTPQNTTSWTEQTLYKTWISGNNALYMFTTGASGEGYFDDLAVQPVTGPTTDGATIVSAKGGTVYNFTSKNASFTYGAASYYCVVRKIR